MRLADFISSNFEPILAEWVTFAESCAPAASSMDRVELRDHALEMLKVIVLDLQTPETDQERLDKSKGAAAAADDGIDTAAEVHGSGRAVSGFTVGEMVSEYRALRASVIRLWTKANGTLTGADLEDLMRFNEAIDQALAESITRYTQDLDHSKEMFLAILGHDLRSPLAAILMASQFMLESGGLAEPQLELTTRIARSGKRMNEMVGDLLDFTRSRLGAGVPIARASMDMGKVASDVVDEVAAAHPESVLSFHGTGELHGNWDAARVSQVIANLLGNAVQYGSKTPISVSAVGCPTEVLVRVHNKGTPIASDELHGLFSPLKRLKPGAAVARDDSNLGLGLYIAERIVSAHGGRIDDSSNDEAGTSFTAHLPR